MMSSSEDVSNEDVSSDDVRNLLDFETVYYELQGSKNWRAQGLSKSTLGPSDFSRLKPVGPIQNKICVF